MECHKDLHRDLWISCWNEARVRRGRTMGAEEDWEEEQDFNDCTCEITGEDACPVHYPIDDGSEDDDCLDCGVCDACIEQSRLYFEQMEIENG